MESEDKLIYHYTDVHGLMGILDSRSLLASHYLFLNDPLEMKVGRNSVISWFKREMSVYFEAAESDPSSKKALQEFERLVTQHLSNDQEVYLSSFALARDDLEAQHGSRTLWERYSDQGGYAIEFSRAELDHCVFLEKNKFGIRNIDFVDVAYGAPNFCTEDSLLVAKCVSWLQGGIMHVWSITDVLDMLMRHLTTTKSWYHRDENEVRIVVIPTEPGEEVNKPDRIPTRASDLYLDPKKSRFLPKQGSISPRYPLFGNAYLGDDFYLPITRIIVGPHTNQDGRMAGLRRYLDGNGLEQVLVEKSEIEIRTQF